MKGKKKMNTMPIQIKRLVWYRRWIHSMIVVILGIAVLATDQAAFAWSYSATQGKAGGVALPKIFVDDLKMPDGPTRFTLLSDKGPIVYRSPAYSGAQIFVIIYYVEQWSGAKWVKVASSSPLMGQISATQTGVQFTVQPFLQPTVAKGYFRFGALVMWFTSGQVWLGNTIMVSNLSSDHVCVTKKRLCQSYPGYVWTGG